MFALLVVVDPVPVRYGNCRPCTNFAWHIVWSTHILYKRFVDLPALSLSASLMMIMQHDQSQCANDDRLKMPETKKKQAAPPTTPTTPTAATKVPDTPTTPTTPTNHVTKVPSSSSNNGEEPHTAAKK